MAYPTNNSQMSDLLSQPGSSSQQSSQILTQGSSLPTTQSTQEPIEGFDEDEEESETILDPTVAGRKRLFSKELRCMMYGFGDDQNPYTESVDLLEDLVIEFITDTTHRAMEIGRTGRVQVEDIIFLVRKDQRKYARVKDLLTMNEELKRARKAFDEIKYVGSEAKLK
ncbi:transcription initiation factor TFIID subunit 13 [Culicoides brevitarsis]|uniref:transcription initiation factor TFIID subunit 13 n=1 Tax=Culicoides brevitarsis TaxID=469753 RepID=UPI00307C2ED1